MTLLTSPLFLSSEPTLKLNIGVREMESFYQLYYVCDEIREWKMALEPKSGLQYFSELNLPAPNLCSRKQTWSQNEIRVI